MKIQYSVLWGRVQVWPCPSYWIIRFTKYMWCFGPVTVFITAD